MLTKQGVFNKWDRKGTWIALAPFHPIWDPHRMVAGTRHAAIEKEFLWIEEIEGMLKITHNARDRQSVYRDLLDTL